MEYTELKNWHLSIVKLYHNVEMRKDYRLKEILDDLIYKATGGNIENLKLSLK